MVHGTLRVSGYILPGVCRNIMSHTFKDSLLYFCENMILLNIYCYFFFFLHGHATYFCVFITGVTEEGTLYG